MMRDIFIPHMDEIPQWKDSYYDHHTLSYIQQFLNEIQQKYLPICAILKQEVALQLGHHQYDSEVNLFSQETKIVSLSPKHTSLLESKAALYALLSKWCFEFTKYSYRCHSLVYIFITMKQVQITEKFNEYKRFLLLVRKQKAKTLLLLENLYIEGEYLSHAISFNYGQQASITSAYEIFTAKYEEHRKKFSRNWKLRRLRLRNQKIMNEIEICYVKNSDQRLFSAVQHLENMIATREKRNNRNQMLAIGLTMGILIMMTVAVVQTDISTRVELQINKTFTQHFPIWRGASYILFYLWLIGLDVTFYQRSQINYRLIFRFDKYNMPESKFIFLRAGILSLVYIVLFYLFTLQLNGTATLNFYHFGAIFWAILLAQSIVIEPLLTKISKRNNFPFYKLLGKVIATPCVKINFIIIWFTEQLTSFTQPFGDLFYTVCFVSSNQSQNCLTWSPFASSAYILTLLAYRMVQNLKLWHQNTMLKPDKKYDYSAPQFLGFFRGLFAFITALLALLDRLKLYQGSFTVWLVSSIITTLYSWFIDIRFDWGILNTQSHNCLREKLLFPQAKYVYYFFALFNLVLRTAWILTISSLIFITPVFTKLVFTMVVSFLEIFRRGVWNILRIENEHIKNCGQFKATITDDKLLEQIRVAAKAKEEFMVRQVQEEEQVYGKNNPKTRLKRKVTLDYIELQRAQADQKQLADKRMTEMKNLFRSSVKQKIDKKEWLRKELKKDRKILKIIALKAYKHKFLNQIKSSNNI